MPCKEMCRQVQYGPGLALGQESAVFGAENNNFKIFFVFFFFSESITCMSPLNECSAVSSTGRSHSLIVTWYTDFLGFTAWSELGVLKGCFSVIISEVFAFVSLAVLQCDQQAGTGHSFRKFIPNTEKSGPYSGNLPGPYIENFKSGKPTFSNEGGIKRCLSKAPWPEIWISSDLGRVTFLRSCEDMT